MYKAVIFDFDYTLGDSTNGIVLSINHALEKLGFRAQDTKTIQRTIGLSLKDTLFELTGIQDEETAQKFTQYFKEKADEFLHMKDASSVLQHILMDAYSETNDFLNVVDFFFVYQSMYNGNCLNIRNECAHGREYISSDSLVFGFKVTLICLKLILDRIDQIKNVEKPFCNLDF